VIVYPYLPLIPSIATPPLVVVKTVISITVNAATCAARLSVHVTTVGTPAAHTPLSGTASVDALTVGLFTATLALLQVRVQLVATLAAKTSDPSVPITMMSVADSAVSSVCVNTMLVGIKPVSNVLTTADVAVTPVYVYGAPLL
jgi:hypothetical protein